MPPPKSLRVFPTQDSSDSACLDCAAAGDFQLRFKPIEAQKAISSGSLSGPQPVEVGGGFLPQSRGLSFADHIDVAIAASHPFEKEFPLHRDLIEVYECTYSHMEQFRAEQFEKIRDIVASCASDQIALAERAHPGIRASVQNIQSIAFQKLLDMSGDCDKDIGHILAEGAPALGVAGGRPDWPEYSSCLGAEAFSAVEAAMLPAEEVIAKNKAERAALFASMGDHPSAEVVFELTSQELKDGHLFGPFQNAEEVASFLGTDEFTIMRRFGVDQVDKIRPCDDALRAHINAGTIMKHKIHLYTIEDFLAAAWRALPPASGKFTTGIKGWKRDHKSAYRQVPMNPEHYKFCVFAVWDKGKGKPTLFIHKKLPFGFVTAVIYYNRIAQAICSLARKLLRIPVMNFYDDFFAVEREENAESGFKYFGLLNAILGFEIKREKDILPTQCLPLLGHSVEISTVPFKVSCTENRLEKIRALCERYLASRRISTQGAQQLAGKSIFCCSALFGKIGRAPLCPIFARCGLKRSGSFKMSKQLLLAVSWLKNIFTNPPSREFAPSRAGTKHKAVLYVDATGAGSLGACLVTKDKRFFTHLLMPPRLLHWTEKRENPIQVYEMAAAILGLSSFSKDLRGANVIVFCDNSAQAGSFHKGFSRRFDCSVLAHTFWSVCFGLGLGAWIEWVASESNVADLPSRLDNARLEKLVELGFTQVEPNVPAFSALLGAAERLFLAQH